MFFLYVLICLPREDFCSFRGGKTRSPPRQKAMLARMTERNAQTGGIHSKGASLLGNSRRNSHAVIVLHLVFVCHSLRIGFSEKSLERFF